MSDLIKKQDLIDWYDELNALEQKYSESITSIPSNIDFLEASDINTLINRLIELNNNFYLNFGWLNEVSPIVSGEKVQINTQTTVRDQIDAYEQVCNNCINNSTQTSTGYPSAPTFGTTTFTVTEISNTTITMNQSDATFGNSTTSFTTFTADSVRQNSTCSTNNVGGNSTFSTFETIGDRTNSTCSTNDCSTVGDKTNFTSGGGGCLTITFTGNTGNATNKVFSTGSNFHGQGTTVRFGNATDKTFSTSGNETYITTGNETFSTKSTFDFRTTTDETRGFRTDATIDFQTNTFSTNSTSKDFTSSNKTRSNNTNSVTFNSTQTTGYAVKSGG